MKKEYERVKDFAKKKLEQGQQLVKEASENESLMKFMTGVAFGLILQRVMIAPRIAGARPMNYQDLLEQIPLDVPVKPRVRTTLQELVSLEKWRTFITKGQITENTRAAINTLKNKIIEQQPIIFGTLGCVVGCYIGTQIGTRLFVDSTPIILPEIGVNLPKVGFEGVEENMNQPTIIHPDEPIKIVPQRKEKIVPVKPNNLRPQEQPLGEFNGSEMVSILDMINRDFTDYVKDKKINNDNPT